MLKGVVSGIALTLAVALIGAYFLVRSGLIPANADAKPGWLETWMAGTSLDATVRREAPMGQNPVELTEQNLLNGVHLFAQNCAVCHGSAKGTASPSPIAKGLYPKPNLNNGSSMSKGTPAAGTPENRAAGENLRANRGR